MTIAENIDIYFFVILNSHCQKKFWQWPMEEALWAAKAVVQFNFRII